MSSHSQKCSICQDGGKKKSRKVEPVVFPMQVVGCMTASPGAEDNPNLEMDNTIDHLISLCALMDVRSGIKHGC